MQKTFYPGFVWNIHQQLTWRNEEFGKFEITQHFSYLHWRNSQIYWKLETFIDFVSIRPEHHWNSINDWELWTSNNSKRFSNIVIKIPLKLKELPTAYLFVSRINKSDKNSFVFWEIFVAQKFKPFQKFDHVYTWKHWFLFRPHLTPSQWYTYHWTSWKPEKLKVTENFVNKQHKNKEIPSINLPPHKIINLICKWKLTNLITTCLQ